MYALQIRSRLENLQAERVLAEIEGLNANRSYALDLEGEIAATRTAFIAAAVTEIAALRAELFGPQVG